LIHEIFLVNNFLTDTGQQKSFRIMTWTTWIKVKIIRK